LDIKVAGNSQTQGKRRLIAPPAPICGSNLTAPGDYSITGRHFLVQREFLTE